MDGPNGFRPSQLTFWWVVYLPFGKMMEFVSWDDDIPFPTEWKFTKFQTTN